MTADFDANKLRRFRDMLVAELLQMDRDLSRMKGKENRAVHEEMIAVKRAGLEFHAWSMQELLK